MATFQSQFFFRCYDHESTYFIGVVFTRCVVASIVLFVLVSDEENIFLHSSHVWILADKVMVFELGIEGVTVTYVQGIVRSRKE